MLPQDMDVGGENGVPLSRLVAFCCIPGGGFTLTLALSHDGRGDRRGGGDWEGEKSSAAEVFGGVVV